MPNEIKRQALGDRDELEFGTDGSLEIYLQSGSPGKDEDANWLAASPTTRSTASMSSSRGVTLKSERNRLR